MYREIPKFQPDEILPYLRKSRSDDPTLSVEEVLERHEAMLNEWIDRNLPSSIPEENWFREVVSGETIDGRPEMKKVLQKIESQSIKAILCIECSRLSRGDLEDCGRLIKLLRYTGTYVITPLKTYDLTDEYDRDAFERELKRGNDYLEYTKKILYRGRAESAKQGFYIGSTPPYGYDIIWIMDGKRKRPVLEINEQEAEVVRMIFDMYVNQGLGVQAIATRLDKIGVKARNGKKFSRSTARDTLRNEHVMGKVVWKRRPITKVVENSEIITKRDVSEEKLLFDGKHEAIIDEKTFYKAQNIYNTTPKVNIDFTLKNPLASLMYCQCGEIMTMTPNHGKHRYRCKYYSQCQTASIDTEPIIAAVCDKLEQEIENFEVKLTDGKEEENKNKQKEIKLLERRISEYEAKEISLWDKYAEDGMPKSIFERLLEKNNSEKEKALCELKALQETINVKSNYEDAIVTFSEALDALRNGKASADTQNNLLKACIKRITYSREKPVRVSQTNCDSKTKNGWTDPDFYLDIEFTI